MAPAMVFQVYDPRDHTGTFLSLLNIRGESGPNSSLASSQHTYMSGTHKAPGSNINTRNLNERHQKSERHPYYGNYRDQSHIPAHITSRPGPQYSTLPPSGDPRTNRMSYAQSISVTRTNLSDREGQNNHRTNNISTPSARQNAFLDAMQKIARLPVMLYQVADVYVVVT